MTRFSTKNKTNSIKNIVISIYPANSIILSSHSDNPDLLRNS